MPAATYRYEPPSSDARVYPTIRSGQPSLSQSPTLSPLAVSSAGRVVNRRGSDNRGTPAPRGRAWRKSVFADHDRVGAVHRADLGDWLAVDFTGRIIGAFAEEPAAIHAVLSAARRRS